MQLSTILCLTLGSVSAFVAPPVSQSTSALFARSKAVPFLEAPAGTFASLLPTAN